MFLIQYKRNDFDLKLIEGHINFNDNSKNVWGNKFNNIKGLYIKKSLIRRNNFNFQAFASYISNDNKNYTNLGISYIHTF